VEGVDLYRNRPEIGADVVAGDGSPVLLIPGYLAGDRSLAPLAGWLREIGYSPEPAAISANVDCATRTADRLILRLEAIAEAHGKPALVVGHSLGGLLGRVLALRRPELVRGVICLGSPLLELQNVNPLVWATVRLMGALGGLGVPGILSHTCLTGDCCAESRQLVAAPFPAQIGFVSVYSRSDGVVDWRTCLDPWAEHVEIESSHVGMAVNAGVYRLLADRLAALGDVEQPRRLRLAA
jgi:pimeloyl-ACP methyl ester carboxylesterase